MYEEIKKTLKKTLSKRRYIHSLGVADEAKRLASIYGADTDKAYLAGLLHDCAKEINSAVQLSMCEDLGVELDEITRRNPGLIHGPLGAEIAKLDYGIDDERILGAIRWHTVGKAGMTLLEKIIYIADFTEPNRDFDGVDELRRTVNSDLDEAILLSVAQHTEILAKRGADMHPNTIFMRNDLISNKGGAENERKS